MGEQSQEEHTFKMITPPNDLKARVVVIGSGEGMDLEAIARAEAALEELSSEFEGWLADEVDKLSKAQERVKKEGITSDAGMDLFCSAHDLKGQADTFGYPLVTDTCASMCKLFDHLETLQDKPESIINRYSELIENHVFVVRSLVQQKIKTQDHPAGKVLARELYNGTMTFIERFLATASEPEQGGSQEKAAG